MANKSLFGSLFGKLLPTAEAVNEAGGRAYSLTPKQALAQYAATGCLNSTFYATAQEQLDAALELAQKNEPEFVAKVALYACEYGFMKDMPALLTAALSVLSPGLMAEIFDRVIDNPKMLRNFVQVMRSGTVGRKSLGTLPKRMIQQWLEARSDGAIFRASVGNSPSLADIIKMTHPKPQTASRKALYAYLIGKDYAETDLPECVRDYERFKLNPAAYSKAELPNVPMEMLTGLKLEKRQWKQLARKASWQQLRMNLNTFARHGVFTDGAVAAETARKLRDPELIEKAKAFPYQLMIAYTMASEDVPRNVKNALQDAMEIAIGRVPSVKGKVWVLPDVSGSMRSPITGHRKGSTTAVQCIDVAALVAAAFVRRNIEANVMPFSDGVVPANLNPRDTVLSNAKVLASLPSGGTNCSAPLKYLNERYEKADLVVYVSDNESWVDSLRSRAGATETMREWERFRQRNPNAKLVCLDLVPSGTTQALDRKDILNIGGFSDAVFKTISEFAQGTLTSDHWVGEIEKMSI